MVLLYNNFSSVKNTELPNYKNCTSDKKYSKKGYLSFSKRKSCEVISLEKVHLN